MQQRPSLNKDQLLGLHVSSKHEYFVPFAYNCLFGSNGFISTPYDQIINEVLDKTISGEIKRLIINIPPRFGKTLRAVIAYVARGYAINPKSAFIHSSFSDELVRENSTAIKDIVSHPDYQRLYPHVYFKKDSESKGLWKTSEGGTFLAKPAGGTITGFGAGVLGQDSFSGALIIDDPLKPDDGLSDTKRNFINQRWHNTFKSRLNDENTPVIVIMQRIHEEDFTYELLDNTEEEWHHLVIPAYIEKEYEYKQSGRYIDHNLPEGSLWSDKLSDKKAKSLMGEIQYSQEPTPTKGEVYEREWFKRYTDLPNNIKKWVIYCDTASKIKKYNDYSVFQLWAQTTENHGYLVKQWREKVKIPFLQKNFIEFYNSCLDLSGERRIKIAIEDKDSGVGLIQGLEIKADRHGSHYKPEAISRTEGKYSRASKATQYVQEGDIYIPVGAMGDGVITEATKFKADDSHKHDDQIDPMNDFINFELPNKRYNLGNML